MTRTDILLDIRELSKKYKDNHLENIVLMQKARLKAALEWIDKGLTYKCILEVQNEILDNLNIKIPEDLIVIIIYSSPFLPFELNEFGIDDSACRDEVYTALSQFFLHQNWPSEKEQWEKHKLLIKNAIQLKLKG